MNQVEIIRTQNRIGTVGDGFWGPKSIAACQNYLKSMIPSPLPFPVEGSSEFLDFYGPHGEKNGYTPPSKKIKLPFEIFYDQTPVKELRVHDKCADSLLRVFQRLEAVYPDNSSRQAAGILVYNGLYNPRLKRGSSSSWSMHAWMNAIDINAGKNGNKTSWPVNATMPIEVMECFAKEGWLSAGAFWGRDAMHFQATAPL
jgi:hypothetical protein